MEAQQKKMPVDAAKDVVEDPAETVSDAVEDLVDIDHS